MSVKGPATLEDVRFRIASRVSLGWAGDAAVQAMMVRVCERAEILMRRHRWVVVRVEEFYPRSDNLLGLNVNHGEVIRLRFRPPPPRSRGPVRGRQQPSSRGHAQASSRLFPFEHVMCVMLHELVHCAIGPHNAAFWAQYHALVSECEALDVEELSRGGGGVVLPTRGLEQVQQQTVGPDRRRRRIEPAPAGRTLGGTPRPADLSPCDAAREAAIRRVSLEEVSRIVFPSQSPVGDGTACLPQCGGCAPEDDTVDEWAESLNAVAGPPDKPLSALQSEGSGSLVWWYCAQCRWCNEPSVTRCVQCATDNPVDIDSD